GASQRLVGQCALKSLLGGALPDARYDETPAFDYAHLDSLQHAVILTGTPTTKRDARQEMDEDQIAKLCRGLYGSRWLYGVYARPVASAETIGLLNELAEQIRTANVSYLLRTSAIDEQNRIAQRYIELLEAKLKRLDHGRTTGMWEARVILLAESAAVLACGQALLHSAFSGEESVPDPVRVRPCDGAVRQGPALEPLNSTEVALLASPPQEEYPGYELVDYARFGVESHTSARGEGSPAVIVGDILSRGAKTGNALTLPPQDLTMHGLVVGVTGSGKTNTCFSLLEQVWKGGVPFLIIESAKSEYRNLLKNPLFSTLKIFTVGDETISPLRLNPFEVPPGVLLQTHIDYLKSLFQAAFVLYPPMPYVLEQSLQEVYEDRGWDLVRNTNRRGETSPRRFPTLLDLEHKIGVVVDRMGYDERVTMDVKAGLLARIKQLRIGGGKGLMLNTRRSTDLAVLFESPCLLELKQVVSDDEKAFIIGLLFIRLYEYRESHAGTSGGTGGLRHLTLIEEAHRLLRNVSTEQGGEVSANPKGRAIEVFANILSEIRAFGEGILIAEQVPVKLTPDAIKNTNLKIIHRLVAEDDRRAVGATMNLSESQMRALATLRPGEGIAFAEGMQQPVRLQVALTASKNGQAEVEAREIKAQMAAFWQRNPQLSSPHEACVQCPENSRGRP
ncbi:MAG TPA: DUF87 domain-containing protein, partial [Blastocatellia bacterium]|nr:DUF87 domain-containing protein [Blastocatellia bacterium]